MNDKADELIKELFDLLKNRYQNDLGSMQGLYLSLFSDSIINVKK